MEQYYLEVPTQYKLLYLTAFFFVHSREKLIVFASNCELVNFLHTLFTSLDTKQLGTREDSSIENEGDQKKESLFDGHIYKLHGDMDHN